MLFSSKPHSIPRPIYPCFDNPSWFWLLGYWDPFWEVRSCSWGLWFNDFCFIFAPYKVLDHFLVDRGCYYVCDWALWFLVIFSIEFWINIFPSQLSTRLISSCPGYHILSLALCIMNWCVRGFGLRLPGSIDLTAINWGGFHIWIWAPWVPHC